MTAAQMLLDAAAKAGLYGLMARSSGPQIRGGEVAAFLRLGARPVECLDDRFDLMVALDWLNVERFAGEIVLDRESVVLCDADAGEAPERMRVRRAAGAAAAAGDGEEPRRRADEHAGLGLLTGLTGLPEDVVGAVVAKGLKKRGQEVLDAGLAGVRAGMALVAGMDAVRCRPAAGGASAAARWNISGNEATGLGCIRGGIRFVAAYPITPATEILEWLAPSLEKVGGVLVQAEDELASINMIIGGSFGGVPALTATSGPGLALMMESIGLAVASETPIVVVDVMRGGPSTGIPTKSEQSDLNIALYGLHGDAPHIVTAARSIADCQFTAQWSVHLAEQLQVPVIVLTDQSLGQSRAVIDRPADLAFIGRRKFRPQASAITRYAVTASGSRRWPSRGRRAASTSPTASACGLRPAIERQRRPRGPARQAGAQAGAVDYGQHWADVEGDGALAIVTWGSCAAGPPRRALAPGSRHRDAVTCRGCWHRRRRNASPLPSMAPSGFSWSSRATPGSSYRHLPGALRPAVRRAGAERPGPLPIRPGEVLETLRAWS
ncbi:MAG: 2-oxoacid:acceptor oxidoreductase family protein [Rhodospirillales bacterium]